MNNARFVLRAAAQRDLDAFADYFETEAGKDLAQRFIDSAQTTFTSLGDTPHIGPPVFTRNPVLRNLRKWRISGFPNYMIFYRPEEDYIRILRVIHAAQDWWTALDVKDQS